MKQGPEKTEFVKETKNETEKYIFQKNKKTKIGFIITAVFLVILIIGLIVSNQFLDN